MTPDNEFAYSPELHLTRLLCERLGNLPEPAQQRFGVRPLTSLWKTARNLIQMDPAIAESREALIGFSNNFFAALSDILTRLTVRQLSLCRTYAFLELAARVWKETSGESHDLKINAAVTLLAISDKTLRDVAEVFQKFEPPAFINQIRVNVTDNKSVLVLEAIPNPESRPYAFDGRRYQRISSTTSILPQTIYQRLLGERAHSRIRWENQPAEGCEIADMDSEEILRTVRLSIAAGRLPESTGSDIGDILERLGLIPV